MAASAAQPASKSSKKKAATQAPRVDSPAPSSTSPADKTAEDENPYIRELQKNIRNINKKIANASKTDSIIAQHPKASLDDLVNSKVINTDQKAQILKRPALQTQLAQLEEQLAQYAKVDEQYKARAAADTAEWEKKLESVKAEAAREAAEASKKTQHDNLLLLSQFLRLAAFRREDGQDPEADESQAIEGVLMLIYAGDESAVTSMMKLIEGSDEQVISVPGEQLQTTYSNIKTRAKEYRAAAYSEAEQTADVPTDPTIAHLAATEIQAGDAALVNGHTSEPVVNGLSNANVSDDAANPVAESHWDTANDMSTSQEWVEVKVPNEPTEPEAASAAPAVPTTSQSWADDQPDPVPEASAPPTDPNDGFHQVQRHRGRHERENSGFQSRGRGRGGRGGGFRGDGRGRGRGRGRGGDNGGLPSRGPRRNDN